MSALLPALLAAIVLVLIPALLSQIGIERDEVEKSLFVNAIVTVILFFVNWLIFYHGRPVVGFTSTSFYQSFWLWMIELAFVIAANAALQANAGDNLWPGRGSMISIVVWTLVLVYGIFNMAGGIWTASRADRLASLIEVDTAKNTEYPTTDTNHIVYVPVQVARKAAGTVMSSGEHNLSTRYELMEPVLQNVDDHAYWIVPMRPSGLMNSNKVQGLVPGYIKVDAEDPNAPAEIQSTDTRGRKISIRYSDGGNFSHNLDRYVWSHGYTGTPMDDWTLEVNDNLRPYWTASVNKLTLNFKRTVPNGLLTVDAQTGAIKQYALSQQPSWVDRVYSAGAAKQLMNWWGNHPEKNMSYGFLGAFRGNADRYKVSGDPTLVYTTEGYPDWQMELTSFNSDKSVSFVALLDGRTSKVRLYRIPDVSLSSSVANNIENSSGNLRKLCPTHIAMHRIYGRLTWVAPLVAHGDCSDDGSGVLQGVALVPADTQINGGNIVIGNSMAQALNAYRTNLVSNGSVKPGEDAELAYVTGKVERVSEVMNEGGTNVRYIYLQGDTHTYRVAVNPNASDAQIEVPFIQVGDKLTMGYNDSAEQRRDVLKIDDLSIKTGN